MKELNEIYRSTTNLYYEGMPVIIEAVSLYADEGGSFTAGVKMRNINDAMLKVCRILIKAFDKEGNEVGETTEYVYRELDTGLGEAFGANDNIRLNGSSINEIKVSVSELKYNNGQVFTCEFAEWKPVMRNILLEEKLPSFELQNEFQMIAGMNSFYVPVIQNGLFQCTCGTVNLATAKCCYRCNNTYSGLNELLNQEILNEKKNERTQKEQVVAAETAYEVKSISDTDRKKSNILKIVAISVVAIAVVIALLYPGVIKPAIDNNNAYKNAVNLLENRLFDDAKVAFMELGDYKDSEDMVLETDYQRAEYAEFKAQYGVAIAIWQKLGDYSDSKARIDGAYDKWYGKDYEEALSLMESHQYSEAADIFATITDYKDSAKKAEECDALQCEYDYENANKLWAEGKYEKALELFAGLGDYEDSLKLYESYSYDYAVELLGAGDYKGAIQHFINANDFNDAREQKVNATYEYANSLYADGNYYDAVIQYENCISHKDAGQKILDAKYKYALANFTYDNGTTYKFLTELKSKNYPGAKKSFDELYAWKIEMIAVNTSENSSVNMTTVSKSAKWYFHFKVEGGEPGAELVLSYTARFPGGDKISDKFDDSLKRGRQGYCYLWYENPQYAKDGMVYVDFYDEAGHKIGEASVKTIN